MTEEERSPDEVYIDKLADEILSALPEDVDPESLWVSKLEYHCPSDGPLIVEEVQSLLGEEGEVTVKQLGSMTYAAGPIRYVGKFSERKEYKVLPKEKKDGEVSR
jgi:hypothetical protein